MIREINDLSKLESPLIILDGLSMRNKDNLFEEISNKLSFPDYFGNNWNALDECLQDLEWINSKTIVLVIKNFKYILSDEHPNEVSIFYDCLKSADDWWLKSEERDFDIYILK